MNRLLSVVLAAMMPATVWGAIVYSGSQNVVLRLSPMNPMSSAGIDIAVQGEQWDDFRVSLWLDTGMMSMMGMPGMMTMPGMTAPMTTMSMGSRLAIYAPGVMGPGTMSVGMGMGMGGILGFMNQAMNLSMGTVIGPMSTFSDWAYLYNGGGIDDEGGYVGLVTPDGRYGWLHVLGQSGIDTAEHGVVFDAWAYEGRPGVSVAAGESPCEWFAGGPHKMHWPQSPDLSPAGVDVSGMGTVLADDFQCTASGPISRIHLWGSFAEDLLPTRGAEAMSFEISIYSDVPAQQDAPSRPGTLLWTRTFSPSEYSVRLVHDGPEGWYEPLTNVYLRDNHRQAYQYNFCVDKDPFPQQEGTVYWLAVKVLEPANTAHAFGWKTTCFEFRWNDDAVYLATDGSWQSLMYPKGHEYAGQTVDLAFVIDSGRDLQAKYDLGDAPDSSNSLGAPMTAYPKGGPPGSTAHFPTVYQAGSPPYGPVHRGPRDMAFLGYAVTLENEADIGPDADPTNNLDPLADVSDADGSDDGVTVPLVLPPCETTTFEYIVTAVNPQTTRMYANAWLDWDRDGDWDDVVVCSDGTVVPEWAVQNQLVTLPGAGTYSVATPPLRCWHPDTPGDLDPIWMRITLSDSPWSMSLGAAGAGPANGYRFGETEDYYFYPRKERAPATYDWGDAPGGRTEGYPTLSARNGARHAIAGPWLGDAPGVPDAESEGRPDPNALADDTDGNDDEEGVWIPPLVQGEPAIITLEVGGGGGIVQAWIDFNGDAAWQSGEQVFNSYLPDGTHTITASVPPDAAVGQSFARFRISTKGGAEPEGPAADGEVEDYDVSIHAAPPQLKRVQWPDLTANGIDIRVDNSDGKVRWLADDFKCTALNRITEVHLWGSWKDDRKGKIQKISLSIRPDDPVGSAGHDPQNRFSKPAPEVLWSKSFGPTEFEEVLYHVVRDPGEWWWDPATEELIPGGDTEVWRIDVSISPKEAFLQQGSPAYPVVYWLEVRVETTEGQFGWKTRRWPDHYLDDAVWEVAADKPQAWKELRYPKGHPYYAVEKNSIDMAFYLTYTAEVIEQPTTRPGSVTQCPVVETQCPAVETRCPAVKTQCPMYKTRCPTTKTRCPSVSTRCPMVATRCPPVKTKCPTTATKCPVVRTKCPEALTKCPPGATQCQVVETQCPPVETKCPAVATKCPEALTKCPPTATKCQVAETVCPPVETKCPVVGTKCPESLTKCPPTATKCQAVETVCPPVETKCPVTATTCPVVSTQCPESLTRCPPTPTQCQAVDTQCPSVQTRCPPVDTRCPATDTKCPTVSTKCPVVATRCPESLTKCPPTVTLCQSIDTQCPSVATRCPESLTKCPPTATQCQTVTTQCPVVTTQCPVSTTKCPPTLSQCQTIQTECPAVNTRCPEESTRCPMVTTQCPASPTKCPPTLSQCQTIQTECPVVSTRCPESLTKCPPTVSQCQTVTTQCPVVTTQCPATPTRCPPTLSQCQIVQTQCPVVQTNCPSVSTQCPVSLTRCPSAPTLCQFVKTQCPICILEAPASMSAAASCPALDVICPSFVAMKR